MLKKKVLKKEHRLGTHYLMGLIFKRDQVDFLLNWRKWGNILKEAATLSGATVIKGKRALHIFDDGGFSLIIVLAESHISIHTWPNKNKRRRPRALIDIFTCGGHCKPQVGAKYIKKVTKPFKVVHEKKLHRG